MKHRGRCCHTLTVWLEWMFNTLCTTLLHKLHYIYMDVWKNEWTDRHIKEGSERNERITKSSYIVLFSWAVRDETFSPIPSALEAYVYKGLWASVPRGEHLKKEKAKRDAKQVWRGLQRHDIMKYCVNIFSILQAKIYMFTYRRWKVLPLTGGDIEFLSLWRPIHIPFLIQE